MGELEDELTKAPMDREARFADAAIAWLRYCEFEKRVKPADQVATELDRLSKPPVPRPSCA